MSDAYRAADKEEANFVSRWWRLAKKTPGVVKYLAVLSVCTALTLVLIKVLTLSFWAKRVYEAETREREANRKAFYMESATIRACLDTVLVFKSDGATCPHEKHSGSTEVRVGMFTDVSYLHCTCQKTTPGGKP